MRIAIIGGGASGCFCAANIVEMCPKAEVTVFESAIKPMRKLAITGAGRCNVTNTFANVGNLATVYPRGEKLLKKLFYEFNQDDAVNWFERHGVPLYIQEDQRYFPKSNNAEHICNSMLQVINRNAWLLTGHKVVDIQRVVLGGDEEGSFVLRFSDSNLQPQEFDRVVVATGGMSNSPLEQSLRDLGIEILPPVPSLFTFKVKSNVLTDMMGISVDNATTMIAGQKFRGNGGLMLTHFGLTGPAILKLSSYAARYLADINYKFDLIVNWLSITEDEARSLVNKIAADNPKKNIASVHPRGFSQRLWEYMLDRNEIPADHKYCDLGKKLLNRMVQMLTADVYHVSGRGQFKDEFVTCGGVSLNAVSSKTLESKTVKGLYFTGEVLDVDAITGGFNLQNCWTTGYVVARAVTSSIH